MTNSVVSLERTLRCRCRERLSGAHAEFAGDHKEHARQELVAARRRAFLALGFTVPVVALAMLDIELPVSFLGHNLSVWIEAALSALVILVFGWQFHIGMLRQARNFAANMDTLISLGTLAALFYSLWAMAAGEHHLYFETGAVIAALILLGRYFEARSRGQASEAIEKLFELGAKTAHVRRDGKEQDIPDRRGEGRRHPAGQTRRESAGRRKDRQRQLDGRRIHAHR